MQFERDVWLAGVENIACKIALFNGFPQLFFFYRIDEVM